MSCPTETGPAADMHMLSRPAERERGQLSECFLSLSPAATCIDLKSSQNNNVSSRGSAAPGPDGLLRGNSNLVGTSGAGRRDGKLGSAHC